MKTLLLNYINQYNSPKRERIIGFWTIILPTLLFMFLSMLFSGCSGTTICHTYDGAKISRPAPISAKAGYTHFYRGSSRYRK